MLKVDYVWTKHDDHLVPVLQIMIPQKRERIKGNLPATEAGGGEDGMGGMLGSLVVENGHWWRDGYLIIV